VRVLVDSTVWSLALRRTEGIKSPHVIAFYELVQEGRIVMIGPVRQEILSGIRTKSHYETLRKQLQSWSDVPIETEDYELAAANFNTCRARGVQGAHTDFLICAIAERHNLAILTTDRDFVQYASMLPVKLFLKP